MLAIVNAAASRAKIENASRTGTYRSAISVDAGLDLEVGRGCRRRRRPADPPVIAADRRRAGPRRRRRRVDAVQHLLVGGCAADDSVAMSAGLIQAATSGVLTDAAMPTTVRLEQPGSARGPWQRDRDRRRAAAPCTAARRVHRGPCRRHGSSTRASVRGRPRRGRPRPAPATSARRRSSRCRSTRSGCGPRRDTAGRRPSRRPGMAEDAGATGHGPALAVTGGALAWSPRAAGVDRRPRSRSTRWAPFAAAKARSNGACDSTRIAQRQRRGRRSRGTGRPR